MFSKILNRERTKLVEDPPHFEAIISMWIASIVGGPSQPVGLLAGLPQVRGVGMTIAQHEAYFGGNFAQQSGSRRAVGHIRWGELGGKRKPDPGHDRDQVQFPT